MPYADLLVKSVVTDTLGLTQESTFSIQVRDQCADNVLSVGSFTSTDVVQPMDGSTDSRQIAFTNPGAANGCTVTHKLFSIDLVTNVETEITANGNVFTWNSSTG